MRALVADRSATTRRVVIRALRVAGIGDVLEFGDARAAAQAAIADVELFVLEWGFEDDSALEFITQLRARPNAAQLKVLVLSERDLRTDIERAAALGVQGYVLKPFETRVIIEQVANAARRDEPAAEAA